MIRTPRPPTPPYSLICLHDATENSQAEARENPVTPWAISRRRGAQRRKPESCVVRALWFPLGAIPENDRQRIYTEGGCEAGRSQAPPDGRGGDGFVAELDAPCLGVAGPDAPCRDGPGLTPPALASHVALGRCRYSPSLVARPPQLARRPAYGGLKNFLGFQNTFQNYT